jgi:hypothetical protein
MPDPAASGQFPEFNKESPEFDAAYEQCVDGIAGSKDPSSYSCIAAHNGTYGRVLRRTSPGHNAGYALPVIRVQSSWREQKVGLSAVLDAPTADFSNSGEDGEPPG